MMPSGAKFSHIDFGSYEAPTCKVTEVRAGDARKCLFDSISDGTIGASAKASKAEHTQGTFAIGAPTSSTARHPEPKRPQQPTKTSSNSNRSTRRKTYFTRTTYSSVFSAADSYQEVYSTFNSPRLHKEYQDRQSNSQLRLFVDYLEDVPLQKGKQEEQKKVVEQKPSVENLSQFCVKKKVGALDRILESCDNKKCPKPPSTARDRPTLNCTKYSTLAQFLGVAPIYDKMKNKRSPDNRELRLPQVALVSSAGKQPLSAREAYGVNLGRKKFVQSHEKLF